MHKSLHILIVVAVGWSSLVISFAQADQWTPQQIASADLARNLAGWSDVEKDVVLHTNLVRMYPSVYLEIEAKPWDQPPRYSPLDKSTSYYQGLLRELRSRPSIAPLQPSEELKASASCFAAAQGQTSQTGHDRSGTGCPELNTGENCDYGMDTGKDIVMHLLVDEDVPSRGHRKNILDPSYISLGVGHASHQRYGKVTVQEFSHRE
ncbi:MAG: CAP domain-containing protein [Bacteroidetes bacterium]|nr:CAP domain-containing protein [Bacteroidota bacterium]MDA0903611.1 CAP domain-containing protein [Bacteroidota bacterium]MDA1242082.1 CAP domain-containing protein [Bacteroidota bacterium]